ALALGVNRFVYHTFAHKPLGDEHRPGMTMGVHGVHWDRGQTWWSMAPAYHRYITRCQHILQQGKAVADILYITPEGAPHIFRPPKSALTDSDTIPDRRGYNFDGCSPLMLMAHASVKDNKIVFPGGASYEIMVLSSFETMTPELLEKIGSLVKEGAVLVGNPPKRSPSLVNYPDCDRIVQDLAMDIWGGLDTPAEVLERSYGKGRIFRGGALAEINGDELYPRYKATSSLLSKLGVVKDFQSSGALRYTHRDLGETNIYFVANRTNQQVLDDCAFRVVNGKPKLWDPVTGETRPLPDFSRKDGLTTIPMAFDAYQSFFVVFTEASKSDNSENMPARNFPELKSSLELEGPWEVSFDPEWGGPEKAAFEDLVDWTSRPEKGIRYYSGIASYHKTFDLPASMDTGDNSRVYLNLGEVNNLARVILNGKDLGVVWTAPWHINITEGLKPGENQLEIQVANLWPNRLIGDEYLPDDGVKDGQWPVWLLEGKTRTSGRYTFTTHAFYTKESPLLKSGLIGPVKLLSVSLFLE
ncbi:MAG: glycosyl hydrolase, partial [Bacteroidales bacterium]